MSGVEILGPSGALSGAPGAAVVAVPPIDADSTIAIQGRLSIFHVTHSASIILGCRTYSDGSSS
ncbi:MAG: hypothetical protein DMG63_17080 [Acidobacteria bacterium]|nr:MAG: hypothetical protein DMG63_17080 [Acidobacteriota bacterium]